MTRPAPHPLWIGALLGLAMAPGASAGEPGFRERVAPVVGKYCVGCHGPEKPKGKLNLAAYTDEAAVLKDRRTWAKCWRPSRGGRCPPKGSRGPRRPRPRG